MHLTEGEYNSTNTFVDGPPGTRVEKDWLNAVQNEIKNAVEGAGLTLKTASTETGDQLYTAIVELISSGDSSSFTDNGYYSFRSGLVLQWGKSTITSGGTPIVFPIAFPNGILNFSTGDFTGAAAASTSNQSIYNPTTAGFTYYSDQASETAYWFAIGY